MILRKGSGRFRQVEVFERRPGLRPPCVLIDVEGGKHIGGRWRHDRAFAIAHRQLEIEKAGEKWTPFLHQPLAHKEKTVVRVEQGMDPQSLHGGEGDAVYFKA